MWLFLPKSRKMYDTLSKIIMAGGLNVRCRTFRPDWMFYQTFNSGSVFGVEHSDWSEYSIKQSGLFFKPRAHERVTVGLASIYNTLYHMNRRPVKRNIRPLLWLRNSISTLFSMTNIYVIMQMVEKVLIGSVTHRHGTIIWLDTDSIST